jgi:hypothetical protein
MPYGVGVGVLCGCRECRWLGGNAPEDHGSGLLNGFQALAQETVHLRAGPASSQF